MFFYLGYKNQNKGREWIKVRSQKQHLFVHDKMFGFYCRKKKNNSKTFGVYGPNSGLVHTLVAHVCNPSNSGGRDQKDHASKPAQANCSETLSQKHPSQKRAGGVTQEIGLSSSPSATKKKCIYIYIYTLHIYIHYIYIYTLYIYIVCISSASTRQ
jgi:hypothetical protein